MKYANIRMQRDGLNNLGDNIQLLAIDNLYSHMGVPQEDVVYIDYYDLSTYDGEYVVLPINYPLYGYRDDMHVTMFSDKIVPVFLGLSLMDGHVDDEERAYLRRFEPIGCRDEHTMDQLRAQGIFAYLNGCMTATLPRIRQNAPSSFERIICVDVGEDLRRLIPDEYRSRCHYVTQMVYNVDDASQVAKEYLKKYVDEADLIITTRLHCAVPCMAMGIPVILLKEDYSFRFPWLNKLLPVYTGEDLEHINWEPTTVEYEDIKKRMLDNASRMIRSAMERYASVLDISSLFEREHGSNPGTVEHYERGRCFVEQNWTSSTKIRYSIWGITQPARLLKAYIDEHCPCAELAHVYDKYKRVEFCGVRSEPPEHIANQDDSFVFVTSASAYREAERMFTDMGKTSYLQCSGDGIL